MHIVLFVLTLETTTYVIFPVPKSLLLSLLYSENALEQ
jgi:hypothetical protein